MDDERLLAEALRAHAAGGVSAPGTSTASSRAVPPPTAPTPGPTGAPAPQGPVTSGTDAEPTGAASRLRERFRPLARAGRGARPESDRAAGPPRPAPPTTPVRAPSPGRPVAGPPPPGPRPAPPPPGPGGRVGGYTGVPHPRRAPGPGAPGVPPRPPYGPAPAPPPAPPADDAGWTTVRIAWWSGIALLSGAVAGAVAAVGTLLLPG